MARVFISYSHKNTAWMERVVEHLKAAGIPDCDVWSDKRIKLGNDWFADIGKAINSCDVALLLISASFLSSEFITGKEVPPLLQRRREQNITIIPVIVHECAWDENAWLSSLQAAASGKPLASLGRAKADGALAKMAADIAQRLEAASTTFTQSSNATTAAPGARLAVSNIRRQTVLTHVAHPSASRFLTTLIDEINSLPGIPAPIHDATSLVDYIATCPADAVQDVFIAIRIAAKSTLPALSQFQRESVEEAVQALYLLAAGRVVNHAAGMIGPEARRVPVGQVSVHAVVAAELFGGRLKFELNARTRQWEPTYLFRIHAAQAGDNWRNAFYREAYRRIVGKDDEDAVRAAREDRELSDDELAELQSELRNLRRVERVACALIVNSGEAGGGLGAPQAAEIAAYLKAPVMLPDDGVKDGLIAMSQQELNAELNQLWKLLRGTDDAPKPPKGPPGDDARLAALIEALLEATRESGSQELRQAVADIVKIHDGKQPKETKLKRVAELTKQFAEPVKNVSDTAESGKKIVDILGTIYNFVAPLAGLPTLPKT